MWLLIEWVWGSGSNGFGGRWGKPENYIPKEKLGNGFEMSTGLLDPWSREPNGWDIHQKGVQVSQRQPSLTSTCPVRLALWFLTSLLFKQVCAVILPSGGYAWNCICPKWSEVRFKLLSRIGRILCYPMDYTVHEILQARILEWVSFPFSRGSPTQ